MTTYTLTESEHEELVNMAKVKNRVGILRLLSALEPNTQEPAFWLNELGQLSATRGFAERNSPGSKLIPLYTHPTPEQTPLTDEQYDELITQVTKNVPFSWRVFARAVEQAHGIEVKP